MTRDDLHVAFAHGEIPSDELANRGIRSVVDRRCGGANDEPSCALPAELISVGSWDDANLEFEGGEVGVD